MGNIRLDMISGLQVEAPSDAWLTAILIAMTEAQLTAVVTNLDKIKRQQLKIIKPTPGMNGKILLPG